MARVKLQVLLRPPARSAPGRAAARAGLAALGLRVTGEGASTLSAEGTPADVERLFGTCPVPVPPRPPSARDFGSPGGHEAADLPVPASLGELVEGISVAQPATRMR